MNEQRTQAYLTLINQFGFLPSLWAITRNLAINLYRESGFTNMAKAQRHCGYGLKHILELFRMK
jgi:hypothetical protein